MALAVYSKSFAGSSFVFSLVPFRWADLHLSATRLRVSLAPRLGDKPEERSRLWDSQSGVCAHASCSAAQLTRDALDPELAALRPPFIICAQQTHSSPSFPRREDALGPDSCMQWERACCGPPRARFNYHWRRGDSSWLLRSIGVRHVFQSLFSARQPSAWWFLAASASSVFWPVPDKQVPECITPCDQLNEPILRQETHKVNEHNNKRRTFPSPFQRLHPAVGSVLLIVVLRLRVTAATACTGCAPAGSGVLMNRARLTCVG